MSGSCQAGIRELIYHNVCKVELKLYKKHFPKRGVFFGAKNMERPENLADAVRAEIENREARGQSAKEAPYLRVSLEAGYALLRASRLHGYEIPVDNSGSAYPVVLQSSMENVSAELSRQRVSNYDQSLIFFTAQDIVAINHIGEEVSEAERRLGDFNEARKAELNTIETERVVEAAERIIKNRE